MTDSDRYRGDGSADRERFLNEHNNIKESAPQLTAKEVERRNAEILREMQQRTIDGFRAAAESKSPYCKELYYRALWRAWRDVRGGNIIRAALAAAAGLDGVELKEEDEA